MRVLVVDDDAAVRQSLSTALGRDGYEVLAADSGGAALAHMAATSVDAIVLDVAMREPNGLEVCRRLRSRGDRTPILMLTARALEERVDRDPFSV
ncbi:MAG: response regulator, partial [Trebonia sp.]